MPPKHRLRALSAHLHLSAHPTVGSETAAPTVDEIGILGWPNLGLPAPEYRHAPRLAPGSPAVNAHLEEHGFVS
jgi:hypothetical protein